MKIPFYHQNTENFLGYLGVPRFNFVSAGRAFRGSAIAPLLRNSFAAPTIPHASKVIVILRLDPRIYKKNATHFFKQVALIHLEIYILAFCHNQCSMCLTINYTCFNYYRRTHFNFCSGLIY